MAKTLFLAPQPSRATVGGKPSSGPMPAHAAVARAGPSAVRRPSRPQVRPHPARRAGHGGLLAVLAVAALTAGTAAWYWLGGGPAVDPGTQLLAEMEAAAQGNLVPFHAFGGTLSVTQGNGRLNVVAEGVPSRACVQVGWRLAKQGTIIVNGTLPTRLSAARLSDLCSGDGATLTWVPSQ